MEANITLDETTVHEANVTFTFENIEGEWWEDEVNDYVEDQLQGFKEAGYTVVDDESLFKKDSGGNWKGEQIIYLEKVT